jgi:hypothetical protein
MQAQRYVLGFLPVLSVATLVALGALGCDGEGEPERDHHEHERENEPPTETTSQALTDSDPLSAVVDSGCSLFPLKGLAVQLVEEIECLKPGTLKRIDGLSGVELKLSAPILPYLQASAVDALVRAQKARGVAISINSGLRVLPQQWLFYNWWKTGKCNIVLSVPPGTSNHESGLAIDINDNAAWRPALANEGFRWLGAHDPVHFDYFGSGTANVQGLSVRAFQRLWNRNHPEDLLDEDGSFGPLTEARLAKSPIGGFAKGPPSSCGDAGAIEEPDAGDPALVPDPSSDLVTPEPSLAPPDGDPGEGALGRVASDNGGCSIGPSPEPWRPAMVTAFGLAVAWAARALRRTRRKRS